MYVLGPSGSTAAYHLAKFGIKLIHFTSMILSFIISKEKEYYCSIKILFQEKNAVEVMHVYL
jgi:flavin-dependent dehydrogenase